MNFDSLLAAHRANRPDHIAFYDQQTPVAYHELEAATRRIANLLYEKGARAGDRLALWLPNCASWLTIFLACAKLGVTVVAMNTRFRGHEVGDILTRGKCSWLAMWPDFKGIAFQHILQSIEPAQLKQLKGILVCGEQNRSITELAGIPAFAFQQTAANDHMPALPSADDDMDALVYTTSGTTSVSKLVVHSQGGLVRHGTDVARAFGFDDDAVVLLGAPMCGAFGFSTALGALAAGVPLVSSPVFDAEETANQVRQYKVTHTFANNELLDRLLMAAKGATPAFPSMRCAGFASFSPSLDALPERADAAGLKLIGLYGSSELQALVAAQDVGAPLFKRRQAGGKLVSAHGRVRARNVGSGEIMPHGEVGEIEIKAPSLMKKYLDNPEATSRAVSPDGYFRTGDLGHTVDEREFVFHARLGDFLRLSGFLVNPVEIEQFIETMDEVVACQVVGVESKGKTVAVAFVVPHTGYSLEEADVIGRCQAHMAKFKVPRRILVVDSFPVVESANSNKIQRSKLQQMAKAVLDA